MRLSKIGSYYVQKQIAVGGQARIFQCVKESQVFAIKVYNQHDDKEDNLFSQQKQLMESLQHPAILSPEQYIPHQTIVDQNHQMVKKNVVIMKYMKNGDLMDYVIKNGRIDQIIVLKMVRSLLECLKYLRDKEVCHCDIKPENILLNQHYEPVLIDFGFILSKLSTKDKHYPKQYHIAPQVKKGLPYTQKSEAFSLGVLIFVLAMGCPPFKQTKHTDPSFRSLLEGKHQIFWKHYQQELKLSISQKLKNTIVNLIEPNPKRRWSYSDLNKSEWLSQDPLSQTEYLQYFLLRQPTKVKNEKIMYEFPFTDNQQTASKSFLEQNI